MYVTAVNKSQEFFLLNVRRLFIFFRRRCRRLHVDASYFFDDDARDSSSSSSSSSSLMNTLTNDDKLMFFRRRRTLSSINTNSFPMSLIWIVHASVTLIATLNITMAKWQHCKFDKWRWLFLFSFAVKVNEQRMIAILPEKCCYLNLRSKVRTQINCSRM